VQEIFELTSKEVQPRRREETAEVGYRSESAPSRSRVRDTVRACSHATMLAQRAGSITLMSLTNTSFCPPTRRLGIPAASSIRSTRPRMVLVRATSSLSW
jgi:hypothetical protein